MKGFIYSLTCSKTGLIYYGSTTDTEKRINKGWPKCSCKNFISPKFEILEELEFQNKKELLLKENDYIKNNICINRNVAVRTKETIADYNKKYVEKNRDRMRENTRKYEDKLKKIFVNCPNCNKELKKRSLRLHLLNHCHHQSRR
jgi:predicted GIY-YIG superfamily endonuclease